mmetsp:Transcript_985/g.2293  ORF Transcript_985/g.2293 Transcript_985/m.2293 type:complete len:537 (-) Transcript_985:5676-7286(-)
MTMKHQHSNERNNKRALAVKLIHKRWRCAADIADATNNNVTAIDIYSNDGEEDMYGDGCGGRRRRQRLSNGSNSRSSCSNYNRSSNEEVTSTEDSFEETTSSIHQQRRQRQHNNPTLLFRRNNTDYSTTRHYHHIHFLTSHWVLAADSYGDLDVVSVKESGGGLMGDDGGGRSKGGTARGREGTDGNGESEDEGEDDGINCGSKGVLLIDRLRLSSNTSNARDAPRNPLDQYLELYGYQNGRKFAVGLPSGGVELYSTEYCGSSSLSSGGNNKGSSNYTNTYCKGRVSTRKQSTKTTYGSVDANAVWGALPPTVTQYPGPRRRYLRSDKYSLAHMLYLDDNEALMELSNDYVTFNEIAGWNDEAMSLKRSTQRKQTNVHSVKAGALWAFREGGIGGGSGTALIGACVDVEGDCFSLRVMDERVCEGNEDASTMVFVDTSNHSKGCTAVSDFETNNDVISICFTGEFGLVTGHCQFDESEATENIVKWWDCRMLLRQPVKSMNLSFPDEVFGVESSREASVVGYQRHGNVQVCMCPI